MRRTHIYKCEEMDVKELYSGDQQSAKSTRD